MLLPVPPATEIATAEGYCRWLPINPLPALMTAAPESSTSCDAWRPSSGRPTICSSVTTVPTEELRVSTMVAAAVTVSVSSTAPTLSVTLMVGLDPTCSVMPLCSKVLKPCSFAASL